MSTFSLKHLKTVWNQLGERSILFFTRFIDECPHGMLEELSVQ